MNIKMAFEYLTSFHDFGFLKHQTWLENVPITI